METVQSADGTAIAFERTGDGPALIVVVGAFCDRTTLRILAEIMASSFTVYSYDRRGRGSSGDTPPYAVEREIEDLDALITAAGGSALVYGHSSGAVLGLEAAARQLAITKLAVYEPPYIVDDSRSHPDNMEQRVAALVSSGRRGDAVKLFLIEGAEVPPQAVAQMEGGPMWPDMEAMAHTLPYDLAICADQVPPVARLGAIQIPTLALSGGESPTWARNSTGAVADAIPGAQHLTLAGQTHSVAHDVLAPVLISFLQS